MSLPVFSSTDWDGNWKKEASRAKGSNGEDEYGKRSKLVAGKIHQVPRPDRRGLYRYWENTATHSVCCYILHHCPVTKWFPDNCHYASSFWALVLASHILVTATSSLSSAKEVTGQKLCVAFWQVKRPHWNYSPQPAVPTILKETLINTRESHLPQRSLPK